ncbi:MAG TPA: WecB/TagA/CpsF family glycosyltransferase [Terriglobales bacterium]|nr:WecB/TagA/CpsF family glycosyltransferase [Terriglobales bacterium]
MIHSGKQNVLGVLVDVIDYEGAIDYVMARARQRRPAAISALAVHGVMTGVLDKEHQHRLNNLDVVLPDGQPVRWALNLLYKAPLNDRCYGPNLTLYLCERAAKEGLPVFFYGGTASILASMRSNLLKKFPELIIAGMEPSKFRRLTPGEKTEVAERINASGAAMVFVGLGCPRQEVFVYEMRHLLSIPALAVGAAFPFIAGEVKQAPRWIQDAGMEWFFRMCMEPRRLWRRYVYLNPAYVTLLTLQLLGLRSFDTNGISPTTELLYG